MKIIDLINKKYNGNIRLLSPLKECDEDLPEQLKSILMNSNGIKETMYHPKTGELMDIAWIIYSYSGGKRWHYTGCTGRY